MRKRTKTLVRELMRIRIESACGQQLTHKYGDLFLDFPAIDKGSELRLYREIIDKIVDYRYPE